MTDYSSVVSMFPPEGNIAAARLAQPANPDQTAQSLPIAKQLNIPSTVVETDPAYWKEQARVQGAREALGNSPQVTSWIAGDPKAAAVAADDIPQLAKVAPTIPEAAPASSFFDSISRGWTATEHNRAVADAALGIGEVPPPLPPTPATEPGIYPYLRDTFGSFIGSMGSTIAHAVPVAAAGAAGGAAVGAAGAGVGALPGAIGGAVAGFGYGIAADMALTAGGAAYEQSGTYRDGDGNALPEPVRKFAAVAAGAGTAALTLLLPGIGKPAVDAGKSIITDTVTKAVPYVAAEIGKAGVKGGLLNMAFTAVQSIPVELARLGTAGFDNLVNDPQARQDFIDKHVEAFVDGVLLFGTLAIPGALVHPVGSAITARADATKLDRLVEAAADSKLKGRSPETFSDFVRTGNKDDIGIAPTNPEALGKLVPPEEVAAAAAAGTDVHLPLSDYVAKVDPATHAALRDDIRMNPEGMTLREAAAAAEPAPVPGTVGLPPVDVTAPAPGKPAPPAERPPPAEPAEAAPAAPSAQPAVGDPLAHLRDLGVLDEDTPLENQSPAARRTVLAALGLEFDESGSGNIYIEPSPEWLTKEGLEPGSKVESNSLSPRELVEATADRRVAAEGAKAPAEATPPGTATARPTAAAAAVPALPQPGEPALDFARRALYLEPLLKEPLPDMTKADFARYSRLLEAQTARAAEVPEPLAGARERAEEKVDRRKDVAAYNTIAQTEGLKLDPASVGDALTHGVVGTTFGSNLPAELLREGGMHPDDIASSLGYRSGSELVRDLSKLDREALVQKEMAQTGAGSLLDRALNSKQLDVLIAETRWLGGPMLTREALRSTVEDWFDVTRLKEATKDQVPVLVRNGRLAEQSLLKGDLAGALVAKLNQAVAFERARQVKALNTEMAAYDRLSARYASQKIVANRDQEYTNHIQAILGALGRPLARGVDELLRSLDGKTLEDFLLEKTASGRIITDAALPRGKPFEEWTVAEFRQLANLLTSLDHNSAEESLVGRVGAKVALDSVVGQIRDNLAGRMERIDPFDAGGIKRIGRNLDAIHLKMERLFDWIDQKDPGGPLNANVFRPIKEGQFAEDEMLREARTALKTIDDSKVRGRFRKPVDNPLVDVDGRPMRLTRGNVIAMALNLGNKSNFDKLVRGYKWDPDTVTDLVRRTLTEPEWKFVQGVWDVFERFWPRADAVVRRMSGIGMDRVDALPVETPFGKLRGGYYPIEYDPLRSNISEVKEGDLFQRSGGFNPLPPAGYTKTRTGVAKPLRLDLDFIGNRLSETIHDIAYREALVGANKVLSKTSVKDAITRSYGPEYAGQIRPWLQYIANRSQTDDRGLGWVNELSRQARLNANVLSIGWNLSTAMVHSLSALSNSIREAGPLYFGGAVADFFRNPTQMKQQWDWANSMSGELKDRVHNMDRDINSILQTWDVTRPPVGVAAVRQQFQLYAMGLIASLDKLSAVPTWIAAYKKGLAEGMAEEDAVYYGDKVVRNAHGSGGLPDLSAIMRGPEPLKWFTMFMSYFNHNYNQVRDVGREYAAAYRDVKVGDLRAGTPHFMSAVGGTMAYLIVPSLVHELIKQGLPQTQQGDNWGAWALRGLEGQVLSMFPLVRDVANYAIQHRGRGIEVASPLSDLFTTMTASIGDVAHKVGLAQGPVSEDWVKHALTAPTALLGIGAPQQLARAGQFLWDISRPGHYRQYANDPVAWYRGLVYGKSHPAPVRP